MHLTSSTEIEFSDVIYMCAGHYVHVPQGRSNILTLGRQTLRH